MTPPQEQEALQFWAKIRKEGFSPAVYIKEAGHKGLGVFAKNDFKEGEILEACYILHFEWQSSYQRDALVRRYSYSINCHCSPITPTRPPCLWNCPRNGNRHVLPLGFGAIYNSADVAGEQNVDYQIFPDAHLMIYTARKPIAKDEECVTWFGQGYYDLWCKPYAPKPEKKKK